MHTHTHTELCRSVCLVLHELPCKGAKVNMERGGVKLLLHLAALQLALAETARSFRILPNLPAAGLATTS